MDYFESEIFNRMVKSYQEKLAELPAPPPGFYYSPEIKDIRREGKDFIIESEFVLKPIINPEQ